MSRPAPSPSASIDSHICRDRPKHDHADAEPGDDDEELRPGVAVDREAGDERARRSGIPQRAPHGAGRGRSVPTSSMSFAKIGSSATAPPRSTANRSSEIAPSRTFVRRIRRTPASTSSSPAAPSAAGARPLRSASSTSTRHEREPDRDRVDELRLDREQEPADRRCDDGRELEGDRPLRERAHEDLLRDERRRERPTGRRADRAPDPLDECEREERPDALRTAPS